MRHIVNHSTWKGYLGMLMKTAVISDTHGELGWAKDVPPCDLLIHAGDLCPDVWEGKSCRRNLGLSASWLASEFRPVINNLLKAGTIKHFAATLGNHDWVTRNEAKILSDSALHFLVDREVEVEGLRVWGSPWSNQFFDWAWMKEPEELGKQYVEIPEGIDILISHQPPISCGSHYYAPYMRSMEKIGSIELDAELGRIKPKLLVCGHIHSGHGVFTHTTGTTVINAAYLDEFYKPKYPIETIDL